MTDIPVEKLEVLKCSSCSEYLSRSPVYLLHCGTAVCGRCYTPNHSAIRNKPYEAAAKLLMFPCKYRELGCRETVPFVDEAEVIAHEEVCELRQYVCPILGFAHCDWRGTRATLLGHCRNQHPDSVLRNNHTFNHDISRSSMHNYILLAFQRMFLLHIKICLATGKIHHSVRFLGTSEEAANYFFNLDIMRSNDEGLLLKGQVAPQGCLEFQEHMPKALRINGILEILECFDVPTFTVRVNRRIPS